MFKKAQGLPLTTIVLAILVLIVLVTVAIFFFGGFSQSAGSTRTQAAVNKCQSTCSTAAFLGDVSSIRRSLEASSFCVPNPEFDDSCCGIISPCFIRARDGTCNKYTCARCSTTDRVRVGSSPSGCI